MEVKEREKKKKKEGRGCRKGRGEGRINKKERKAGRKFANWVSSHRLGHFAFL